MKSRRRCQKRKIPNNFSKVVAYQPTGWTHTGGAGGYRRNSSSSKSNEQISSISPSPQKRNQYPLLTPRQKGNITIYATAYSEHSSFTELVEFVQTFRPQRIIPTVNTGSPQKIREQIDRLKRHCSGAYMQVDA